MESNLDSILGGSPATEQPTQQTEVEAPQTQEPVSREQQDTGEAQTTSPVAEQKDDPLDKARKGIEAAAAAERRKRQEAESQLAAMRQEMEALRRPQQQQQPTQQRSDDPKPQRSEFASEDEWLDARDAWRDRQQVRETQAREAQKREAELAEKTQATLVKAMTLPGFDLQAFSMLPVTEAMTDAILESESGHALVHFLATNPDETKRISGLSIAKQIAELTRIEDKLKATPTEEEQEEKPVTTKEKPRLPNTLTQARNAKGQFEQPYSGPTPLNAILK